METPYHDLIEEYQSEDIMSVNHSRIIHRMSVALNRYEDQFDILPELELELSTGKCKPDVSVFPKMPVDWLNDIVYYNQPPIIAIEILSPRQALNELTDKAYKQCFPAGVQTVWLIIPVLQVIHILLPDGSKRIFSEGLLIDPVTSIELNLAYIFK
ncbi:hypothetical protein GCM10023187_00780 [Nibrella viscosa]|uniref:Putative restriction endonuclease domain-containing protein n=1 Tax=Nibrella viscosa TaxID=1084524 RepID=A0ABP8JQU8_9BACT